MRRPFPPNIRRREAPGWKRKALALRKMTARSAESFVLSHPQHVFGFARLLILIAPGALWSG